MSLIHTIPVLHFLDQDWPDVAVLTGRYENDDLAVVLTCEDGEPLTRVSVNVPNEHPAPGCVFIRDYSENAGLADALVAVGVVEPTGRTILLPPYDSRVVEARLLVSA